MAATPMRFDTDVSRSANLFGAARGCAFLAPLFLLAGDIAQVINRDTVVWTVLLWVAFILFVPAVIGLEAIIHRRAPVLAITGGALALIGAIAGATMQALFRAQIVLRNGGLAEAETFLGRQPAITLTTLMPGILFPVGLLILAIALWRSRVAPVWLAATLAVGAIMFPIGHAVGFTPALIIGDVILLIAFASVAVRINRTRP